MTIEGLTDTSRVEGSRQSLLEFNISELFYITTVVYEGSQKMAGTVNTCDPSF